MRLPRTSSAPHDEPPGAPPTPSHTDGVVAADASPTRWVRAVARLVLAAAMIVIGVLHFTNPDPFVRIMPPWLPAPLWLVWLSGVAEIALGAVVLVPEARARRLARWGLVALYVAVFPANLHMALSGAQLDPDNPLPAWAAWARLPFQAVFILWAIWVTRPSDVRDRSGQSA